VRRLAAVALRNWEIPLATARSGSGGGIAAAGQPPRQFKGLGAIFGQVLGGLSGSVRGGAAAGSSQPAAARGAAAYTAAAAAAAAPNGGQAAAAGAPKLAPTTPPAEPAAAAKAPHVEEVDLSKIDPEQARAILAMQQERRDAEARVSVCWVAWGSCCAFCLPSLCLRCACAVSIWLCL